MHVELVQEGQAVAEPQPTLMIIAQYIVLADFTDQVELLQKDVKQIIKVQRLGKTGTKRFHHTSIRCVSRSFFVSAYSLSARETELELAKGS